MKITPQLLKNMGATKHTSQSDYWELGIGGYTFYFHSPIERNPTGNWYFGLSTSRFHCHDVSDIEECIGFAMQDGYIEGRASLRKDIKELLDVNNEH